jgi:hypothetical protein
MVLLRTMEKQMVVGLTKKKNSEMVVLLQNWET